MTKHKKPTLKKAVLAFCHMCMGYWHDGVMNCENYVCQLYSWQIRADKAKAKLEWMKYNPKRRGKVTWEECERDISDEEREALKERGRRLAKSRKKSYKLIEENFLDNHEDDLDEL